MDEAFLLFLNDQLFFLVNDINFFVMDYWLSDFMDMLFMYDWLMEFLNDVLLILCNNFFVLLMYDILMIFMNHS